MPEHLRIAMREVSMIHFQKGRVARQAPLFRGFWFTVISFLLPDLLKEILCLTTQGIRSAIARYQGVSQKLTV